MSELPAPTARARQRLSAGRARAPAPRRDGAAQRPADPRPDRVGGRRPRRRRLDRGRLGAEAVARPRARSARSRCCAARCGSPRRSPSCRSRARGCARRGCRSRTRAVIARRSAAVDARPAPAAQAAAGAAVGRELAVAALGALPALAALRDRDLAAYHGVEHKAIGGYETRHRPGRGAEGARALRLEPDRADARALGRRPGARRAAGRRARPDRRAPAAAWPRVGAAVELFAYAERNPGSPVGRAVHGPGHEIQRLVSTREPTPEQMEVGVAALDEILRAEGVAADTV